MVQMKQLFLLFLVSIFFVTAFTLTGCNKSDSNPVGGGGSLDPLLVGVWWNSSDGSGVQIASDGTALSLTSYSGKIAVDTSASARSFTIKISASGGTGTRAQTGKWPLTGKDTTITGSFTYVLSNSNNTLSVTEIENSVTVTMVFAKSILGDAISGGLVATPNSVTVVIGSNATVTINGGTTPYTIVTNPTSTVATATISGSTLSVTGVAVGTTSVVVKDNSSPTKTVTVGITVTATATGLTASPTSVSVAVGSASSATISGGTTPYTIQTAPSSSIATASISGATLSVSGVAVGVTSVVVKDNSSPAKTVTVSITVTSSSGGFSTAGSLSFSSDKGNFSANGIFDPNVTTGSGAGAMVVSSGGSNTLTVYGFRANGTSYELVLAIFMDSAPIATGSYTYPPTTGSKLVMISYFPAVKPNDTTDSFYLMSSAAANISAMTSSNSQGTFSGSGMYYANGTLNPSQTISITGGTFNVPVIPVGSPDRVSKKIERIVKRIVSLQKK